MTEYIFIKDDGSRHFEIVLERGDAMAFHKMHNARLSMPLERYEAKYGEVVHGERHSFKVIREITIDDTSNDVYIDCWISGNTKLAGYDIRFGWHRDCSTGYGWINYNSNKSDYYKERDLSTEIVAKLVKLAKARLCE